MNCHIYLNLNHYKVLNILLSIDIITPKIQKYISLCASILMSTTAHITY